MHRQRIYHYYINGLVSKDHDYFPVIEISHFAGIIYLPLKYREW
jgi:hypothetical protein